MNEKNIPLADIHTHTSFSPDGHCPPADVARLAFERGVRHLSMTDHAEIDQMSGLRPTSWDFFTAIEENYNAYLELKAEYSGRMEIYSGIELGQALYDTALAEKVLAAHDYDFVLGSLHRMRDYPNIKEVPDTPADRSRALREYFDELIALAEWGKFCSLSHLSFPARFMSIDTPNGAVSELTERSDALFDTYRAEIDKILGTVIRSDIALEANSSGIRKGLGTPMASARILARYRELGGRMVTTGSDGHRADEVAFALPETFELLRELGFTEVFVFEKKTPRPIPIV